MEPPELAEASSQPSGKVKLGGTEVVNTRIIGVDGGSGGPWSGSRARHENNLPRSRLCDIAPRPSPIGHLLICFVYVCFPKLRSN